MFAILTSYDTSAVNIWANDGGSSTELIVFDAVSSDDQIEINVIDSAMHVRQIFPI